MAMVPPDIMSGCTRRYAILLFALAIAVPAHADYTTIWNNGPSSNRLDITIIGDGYTASALQSVYPSHISQLLAHMFFQGEQPFPRYQNFFNVHQINQVSNETGADEPPLGIFRDTALDASYWGDGVTERLLTISQSKAISAINNNLAGSDIEPDIAIVTVNSTRYGGSGGLFAVYAGGNSQASEIALHELGHSFSGLADEYGGNPGVYAGGEPSEVNVTKSAGGEKWAQWLGYDQPGIGVIGTYEGGRYFDQGIYRPSLDSKMRSLFRPFDAVSREDIILDMYLFVDPLDAWLGNNETVDGALPLWVTPIDADVVRLAWYVNDLLVEGATQPNFLLSDYGFGPGTYTVRAHAFDDTDWVRIRLDDLQQDVIWTVLFVPEPSSIALAAVALVGLIALGRRKRA